jgi:4'-phosphopantetheinyl transferase
VEPLETLNIADIPIYLDERSIHVWPIRISPSIAVVARFERFLTADERARAARFKFRHLQHSFLISRGILRALIGRYIGTPPGSIRFAYGPAGKPSLETQGPIRFNASRSGNLAVFALTRGCELGIDIERIRIVEDIQSITDRLFCPEETEELMSMTTKQRERAFFLCWSRKEAYVKATGDGLSMSLTSFRVSVHPSQPARFIHIARDANAANEWSLHDLALSSDCAAALAYADAQRPVVVSRIIEPPELLSWRL